MLDSLESLHIDGRIPDSRNALLNIWRDYEDISISDVAFYLRLNHSRLVTSKLIWRPDLKQDIQVSYNVFFHYICNLIFFHFLNKFFHFVLFIYCHKNKFLVICVLTGYINLDYIIGLVYFKCQAQKQIHTINLHFYRLKLCVVCNSWIQNCRPFFLIMKLVRTSL